MKLEKKPKKFFLYEKIGNFLSYTMLFFIFYDAQFIFYAKLQSCKALNFRLTDA